MANGGKVIQFKDAVKRLHTKKVREVAKKLSKESDDKAFRLERHRLQEELDDKASQKLLPVTRGQRMLRRAYQGLRGRERPEDFIEDMKGWAKGGRAFNRTPLIKSR